MSIFKIFRIKENLKMEYRAEFFNVFNHPQITGAFPSDLMFAGDGMLFVSNAGSGTIAQFDAKSGE